MPVVTRFSHSTSSAKIVFTLRIKAENQMSKFIGEFYYGNLDCKLNRYLAGINKQAEEMFDTLIAQYKTSEGITEQLKATNQMEWVARMNGLYLRVAEII